MNSLEKIDLNVLFIIQDKFHSAILDNIMPFITKLGNLGMIWVIFSILLLINKKYRKVGIMCACSLMLSTVLGEGILKHLIQRPRPFIEVPNIHILVSKPASYSFPSGHTASSFAAVGIIWSQLKRYRFPALILGILIAFSRMYLFLHYPSDILGGMLLGITSAIITLNVLNKKYSNKISL